MCQVPGAWCIKSSAELGSSPFVAYVNASGASKSARAGPRSILSQLALNERDLENFFVVDRPVPEIASFPK
jgi:hypothetical protein